MDRDAVAKWAIFLAVLGAVCGAVAIPLGISGVRQLWDLNRYNRWVGGGGGFPPGAYVAWQVLIPTCLIFLLLALALGIYALKRRS
jgi:hypothetical protein